MLVDDPPGPNPRKPWGLGTHARFLALVASLSLGSEVTRVRLFLPSVLQPGTAWHLAPPGAHTCDTGTVASQAQCEAAVKQLAASAGRVPRRPLQIGSGGTCSDDSWGRVPIGCSAQSGPDGDWTAHYKTSGAGCSHNGCVGARQRSVIRNELWSWLCSPHHTH